MTAVKTILSLESMAN